MLNLILFYKCTLNIKILHKFVPGISQIPNYSYTHHKIVAYNEEIARFDCFGRQNMIVVVIASNIARNCGRQRERRDGTTSMHLEVEAH